jgi:hypothetical protein
MPGGHRSHQEPRNVTINVSNVELFHLHTSEVYSTLSTLIMLPNGDDKCDQYMLVINNL